MECMHLSKKRQVEEVGGCMRKGERMRAKIREGALEEEKEK